jgi:hypothetical protein
MSRFFKPLFSLGLGALALVSLFRHSIEHAIDAHPLLSRPATTDTSTRLHFSPDEDLERFDEQQLLQAHSSVDISMYSFTIGLWHAFWNSCHGAGSSSASIAIRNSFTASSCSPGIGT